MDSGKELRHHVLTPLSPYKQSTYHIDLNYFINFYNFYDPKLKKNESLWK